jgi:hypothetical protein
MLLQLNSAMSVASIKLNQISQLPRRRPIRFEPKASELLLQLHSADRLQQLQLSKTSKSLPITGKQALSKT